MSAIDDKLGEISKPKQRSRNTFWRRFLRSPTGLFGAILFGMLIFISVLSPVIVPYSPLEQVSPPLLAPSTQHFLGTDELGRDILSRVIAGSRLSIAIAVGAAILSAIIGTPLGVVAGYFGGVVDGFVMRITDFALALPGILAALVVIVVLGSNAVNVAIAIAIGSSPAFARLSRAKTLEVKTRAFVQASKTMGASHLDIMMRTIAPNVIPPLVVQTVVTASMAVLATAALSFLGLGAPPPAPTWGAMLHDANSYLWDSPIYGIAPGLALTITVVAFDALGKGVSAAIGGASDHERGVGGHV